MKARFLHTRYGGKRGGAGSSKVVPVRWESMTRSVTGLALKLPTSAATENPSIDKWHFASYETLEHSLSSQIAFLSQQVKVTP
jgi:hypothetical protein